MINTKNSTTIFYIIIKQNGFRLIALVFFIALSNIYAWNQTEFMIFTFFDPCLSTNTDTANKVEVNAAVARFLKAKEAHFNLLTGFQNDPFVVQTQAGMDYALFVTSKIAGLRSLIVDKRYNNVLLSPPFQPYQPDRAIAVTDHYKKSLSDRYPSRRNALLGYTLGDEPRLDDARNVKNWISHFKRNDASKLAYVNLLPSYSFKKRAEYEAYLDSFLNDPAQSKQPDVVCFDHYPFFKDGKVRRDYFYNLRIIRKKAGTRPFWMYIQSVDHLNYVNPSIQHFRFMAFCPLAYGAKGIGYFTYEQPNLSGYRDALVNACTTQTAKYVVAQTINLFLEKIMGPVIMHSTNVGTFHKSKKPTGEASQLLTAVNAPCISDMNNDHCMIGIFKSHTAATTYYCLIVNKSLSSIHTVVVTLKGNYSGRVAKAPSIINYTGDTAYSIVPLNAEGNKITIPSMEGGEGQLYRMTNVLDPW